MDRLAEVYETFEDTWDIVVKEPAEGDMLFASEEDAVDKLEAARQHLQVLEDCRKSMESALREFSNRNTLHEAAWSDVKEAGRRHSEPKRKEEAHTRTFLQRESIRRATSDQLREPLMHLRVASLIEKVMKQSTCGHD